MEDLQLNKLIHDRERYDTVMKSLEGTVAVVTGGGSGIDPCYCRTIDR